VKRTAEDDGGEGAVRIDAVEGAPREQARQNRGKPPPPGGAKHQARPFRKPLGVKPGAPRGR
jgi:hypothetical protein